MEYNIIALVGFISMFVGFVAGALVGLLAGGKQ